MGMTVNGNVTIHHYVEAGATVNYNGTVHQHGTEATVNDESRELPEALKTPEAQAMLKKAQAAGWLDEDMNPKCSRTMIALVVSEISERLKLNPKWKPFEEMWDLDGISKIYSKAMEQKASMTRIDDIRKALK